MSSVEVKLIEIDERNLDVYPTQDCPDCPKGIVTIGHQAEIEFPPGSLASDRIGKIKFNHFTCDRCNFKILCNVENKDFF